MRGQGANYSSANACFAVGSHTEVHEDNRFINTYTDNGTNSTHSVLQRTVQGQYCQFCDRFIGETTIQGEYSLDESHNWDSDGVCYNCGHVNTCTHENSYRDWGFTGNPEYEYEDNGDGTHTTTGTKVEYDYCPDCRMWYNYTYTEGATEIREHNWGYRDGICQDCGAECDHPEDARSLGWVSTEDPWTYEDAGSDRVHRYSCTEAQYTVCEVCGKQLGEALNTRARSGYEQHNYSYDGSTGKEICYNCGHVKQGMIDKTVTLSVSKTEVLSRENFQITVMALDANSIELHSLDEWNNDNYIYGTYDGGGTIDWHLDGESTREFYAIAYYEDGTSVESEHVTVVSTAPYGTLAQPEIFVSDEIYAEGSSVTFTIGEVEHANQYNVWIGDHNGKGLIDKNISQPESITIPADKLSSGCYWIQVQVNGIGAYSIANDAWFTVGEHSELQEEIDRGEFCL